MLNMLGSLQAEGLSPEPGRNFCTTHWSVVVRAGKDQSAEAAQALETLCRSYWYPLFSYLRGRGFSVHQAEDLTQAFFSQLLTKKYLATADPGRGRFRTFLLTSLDHFLANEWNRERARKRGGGFAFISLDYVRQQEERPVDPGHDLNPQRLYERRWAEAVLAQVLERLRKEFDGSSVKRFKVLKPFLTELKGTSSYAAAARELGVSEQAVKSAIHRLRQRWRELMREEIGHTLNCATSKEIDEEIRYLISVME
jgi:RNA polymerase sigma factor (sigma-70 family)